MKSSDELHQLIKSMNMSEKRHFKIHSSRHVIGEKNNYLHLFDAIAAQQVYEEAEIKKQFSDSTFIKHLPSEKHYLYNHVLESLNSFNKEKTFLSRHANILISIEILYNRGLFAQAKKIIRKAKAEAYSLEKFSVLLLLVRWETIIFIKDEDEKNLDENISEELRILEVMRIQYQLMRYAFSIQIHIDKGHNSVPYLNSQERAMKKSGPASERVNSFWAKYYYHSSIGLLSSVRNKQMMRYQSYKEIKMLMDKNPQFIKDLPWIYHLNVNNLANTMFLLKKYTEAEMLLKQQRVFLPANKIKNSTLEKIVFLNTHESELFLHYKTMRYDKAEKLIGEIDGEIKKIDLKFSPLLFDLYFMMAVVSLMAKNYKGATRWLNKMLNAERITFFRKELQVNSRLLFLIVLLESDDLLFENRFNSTKRFLANEPQFKTQQKILEAIRLITDKKDKNKPLLKNLLQEIKRDWKKTNAEALNKQFDFAEWMESKMKN